MSNCKTCGDPLFHDDNRYEGECAQCHPDGYGLDACEQDAYASGVEAGQSHQTPNEITITISLPVACRLRRSGALNYLPPGIRDRIMRFIKQETLDD